MRRLRVVLLALFATAGALPTGAQVQAVSTFSNYSSPFTTEFQATIGRPVTSGVLDFYSSEAFLAPGGSARNVLGTWGTSPADPGFVNHPTNEGSSTTMFITRAGDEIDVFGTGSDPITGMFKTFSLFSIDVAHLWSTSYAPGMLVPISFTVFGVLPSNTIIQQVFTIPAPPLIGGVQQPALTTLTLDSRFLAVNRAAWFQGTTVGTVHQFTNVNAAIIPEPSTYVLTLTGLVSVGLIQLRRRKRTA